MLAERAVNFPKYVQHQKKVLWKWNTGTRVCGGESGAADISGVHTMPTWGEDGNRDVTRLAECYRFDVPIWILASLVLAMHVRGM